MPSKELEVMLGDVPVGTLVRTRAGARFAYTDDIVARYPGLPVLSISLPVKRRAFAEGTCASWFSGLLPEGGRLERICREFRCSEFDYFGILEQIGWECAGAVSIRAKGFEPSSAEKPVTLSEDDLANRLKSLPDLVRSAPLTRVSLGGFQDKLALQAKNLQVECGVVRAAEWVLPDASTISTHILKPQPQGQYPGLVEGEAWAMTVAGCAARASRVALLDLEDAPLTLVVERYDRDGEGESVARVHQEDCCQALGIAPSGKYAGTDRARGSDPTYQKIAALLMTYAANPRAELDELLRQMTVNLVLGNLDAHAKNYSLLYTFMGVPELAPLYDVVPVADIEPRTEYLSMRIAGKLRAEEVAREDLLYEAQSWGMPRERSEAVLRQTFEGVFEGLDTAAALYGDAASRHEAGVWSRLRRLS